MASSLTSTAMTWRTYRRPSLRLSFVTDAVLRVRLWQGSFAAVVFVIAVGLAALLPVAGLIALLALSLSRFPTRWGVVQGFLNR